MACSLASGQLLCSRQRLLWGGPRWCGLQLAPPSASLPPLPLRLLARSDEMYRGLELDPAHRLPAAVDAYDRGISLSGTSKAVGGPGLRIGWVATKDSARELTCLPPQNL